MLNKLSGRRKFYTVTMANDEKVLTYLNRVRHVACTLKSINVEIDDEGLGMAVLNGLPVEEIDKKGKDESKSG